MKKLLCLFWGLALFISLPSCFKLDNWDAPSSTMSGTVIDSNTGQPLLASQDDWQIRIWERSWTGHEGGATNHQDLRIKQDGTYLNTKLFDGTYDMLFYNGPFWPVDTLKGLVLNGRLEQDMTVTPYLQIVDYTHTVGTTKMNDEDVPAIIFKFKVKATVLEKDGRQIPNLREVRAWLSWSTYCGNGSNSFINISDYTDNNKGRLEINRSWNDLIQEVNGGNGVDTSQEYTITLPVRAGDTYYVRAGANVNDTHQKYNYSPIGKVDIPK
jgi:hypothetical protein